MSNKIIKTASIALSASFGILASNAYAQSVKDQVPACSVSIIREIDDSAVNIESAAEQGYVGMGHKESFKVHIDSCINDRDGGVVSLVLQKKRIGTFHVHAGDDLDHSDSSQGSFVFLSSSSSEGREVGAGRKSDGELDITISRLAHEPPAPPPQEQLHPEEATRGFQLFAGVVAEGEDVSRKYGVEDFQAASGGITYRLRLGYDPRRVKASIHYKPITSESPAPLPPFPQPR